MERIFCTLKCKIDKLVPWQTLTYVLRNVPPNIVSIEAVLIELFPQKVYVTGLMMLPYVNHPALLLLTSSCNIRKAMVYYPLSYVWVFVFIIRKSFVRPSSMGVSLVFPPVLPFSCRPISANFRCFCSNTVYLSTINSFPNYLH